MDIVESSITPKLRQESELTRQRGQINTIGVGLLRTRNSGKF